MVRHRQQIKSTKDEGEILCKQFDCIVFINAALPY